MIRKTKKTYWLIFSLPLLLLFLAAGTKKPAGKTNGETVAEIDKIVLDEMAKRYYVGCAVAVVKNGRIIHQKGYGHLNELRTQPVTTNTVFKWASISKVLTAAAAWKLIENGRMGLNSRVHQLVSYWPDDGNKDLITVSHLMNHRSGINHYDDYNQNKYRSDDAFNAEQSVKVFRDAGLRFKPDTKNYYSTFGYNLLGAVVDVVSSNGYVEFIRNNIKEPLGLSSLVSMSTAQEGYELSCNGGLNLQDEGATLWKLPGGGWASNVEDLAKFMTGLMNNGILNRTSQMWEPVPNNSSYCFGLKNETQGSEKRISHGGANDEISTEMAFYPGSDFGVVVMINGDAYCDAENMAKRIEKYYGKSVSPDEDGVKNIMCTPGSSCVGVPEADRLVGVWRPDAGETIWRRRMGEDQFIAEKQWLDDEPDYDLVDFETYSIDGARYWDAIFKKQNKSNTFARNFSQEGFHNKWEELNNDGFRLIDLETYEENGNRLWAGVFEKGSGDKALYRNYRTADFVNKHKEKKEEGLRLIDVEVFKDSENNLLWSGVWRAGTATHFIHGKSIDEFNDAISAQLAEGYRLLDVETYLIGSKRLWAGVFDSFSKSCAFKQDRSYCQLANDDATLMQQTSPQHLQDMEIFK
jgi:CubicO group peptidase (beta-lactamase class C family)